MSTIQLSSTSKIVHLWAASFDPHLDARRKCRLSQKEVEAEKMGALTINPSLTQFAAQFPQYSSIFIQYFSSTFADFVFCLCLQTSSPQVPSSQMFPTHCPRNRAKFCLSGAIVSHFRRYCLSSLKRIFRFSGATFSPTLQFTN